MHAGENEHQIICRLIKQRIREPIEPGPPRPPVHYSKLRWVFSDPRKHPIYGSEESFS